MRHNHTQNNLGRKPPDRKQRKGELSTWVHSSNHGCSKVSDSSTKHKLKNKARVFLSSQVCVNTTSPLRVPLFSWRMNVKMLDYCKYNSEFYALRATLQLKLLLNVWIRVNLMCVSLITYNHKLINLNKTRKHQIPLRRASSWTSMSRKWTWIS